MIVVYPNTERARGRRYPESVSYLLSAVCQELQRDRKKTVEVAFLYPARRLPSGTVVDPSGFRFRMTLVSNERPYRNAVELLGGQTVVNELELDRHAINEAAKFLEQQSLAAKITDEIGPGVYRGNSRWSHYSDMAGRLRAMLRRPKKSKGASRRAVVKRGRPVMTRKARRTKKWQR